MPKPVIIAVDAMGGDNSPNKTICGIKEYLTKKKDVYFRIFGRRKSIENELLKHSINKNLFEIINCDDVVENNDTPLAAAKKKNTSMWQSINDVKNKKSDVIVSAGNTGALFVISKLSINMIENISKPALAALWPNKIDMNIVLDLGANIDCSSEQLKQFALLGSLTAEHLFSVKSPSVRLLNIGSETTKGNLMIQQAAELLQNESSINYQGFIEGDGLFAGMADIVVCDGFSGNIALKASEGAAKLIGHRFSEFLNQDWRTRLASTLIGNRLSKLKLSMQPAFYNGAYLLGLNAVLIKSHGGADKLGFKAALNTAIAAAEHQLPSKLAPILEKHT